MQAAWSSKKIKIPVLQGQLNHRIHNNNTPVFLLPPAGQLDRLLEQHIIDVKRDGEKQVEVAVQETGPVGGIRLLASSRCAVEVDPVSTAAVRQRKPDLLAHRHRRPSLGTRVKNPCFCNGSGSKGRTRKLYLYSKLVYSILVFFLLIRYLYEIYGN